MEFIYEDGLRLSELYGKLAEIDWNIAHFDVYILGRVSFTLFCIIVLGIICSIGVMYGAACLADYMYDPRNDKDRLKARCLFCGVIIVYIIMMIYFCVVVTDLTHTAGMNSLLREQANVQMQIDSILARYA